MAVEHRSRLNRLLTGGLPYVHTDRFRPQDYIIDKLFLQGKLGDVISQLVRTPCIVSGLVVTKGVGDTLDITAGSAILYDNQTPSITEVEYNGTNLAPAVTVPAYLSITKYDGVINMAIPSATLDGSTVNYVKVSIVDASVLTRGTPVTPAPPYDFLMKEAFSITVNSTAPTATELLLTTFTGTSGGAFTFVANPDTSTRSHTLGISPSSNLQFTAPAASGGLEYWGEYVTATKARIIMKYRNQVNTADPIYVTILNDTTTPGAEKGAVAFTRGNYYGAGGETPLFVVGRKNDSTNDSVEAEVPFLTRGTSPAIGWLGAADEGKWITRLTSNALDFMGDNTTSVQTTGTADVTYKSRTYKPKMRLSQNGDIHHAGKHIFRSSTSFDLTIQHALSANRTQTHQDRDGILALTDDISSALNRSYLYGLDFANDAFDPVNDLDIAPGEAVSNNGVLIRLLTALIKRIDANWAAGTNQGMLDSGTVVASSTYFIYLIANVPLGTVDVIASLSAVSPSLPAGFTEYRRIGALVTTAGTSICQGRWTESNRRFMYDVIVSDVNTNYSVTSAILVALSVPTGIKVRAIFASMYSGATTASIAMYTSPEQADTAPTTTEFSARANFSGGGGTVTAASEYIRITNVSGEIRVRNSTNSGVLAISTLGWEDYTL